MVLAPPLKEADFSASFFINKQMETSIILSFVLFSRL